MITVNINESSRRQKAQRALLGLNDRVSTFAIITPENNMHDMDLLAKGELTKEDVINRNRECKKDFVSLMKGENVLYFPVKGVYGEKENSFILYNISQKYAEYLGHRFDQESFIFAERKANDSDENKIEFSFYSKQISEKDEELARKHPSLLQYRLIDTTTDVQTTNLNDDMTIVGKNFSFRIPFGIFSGNVDAINKMVEERVEKSPAYVVHNGTAKGLISAMRGALTVVSTKNSVSFLTCFGCILGLVTVAGLALMQWYSQISCTAIIGCQAIWTAFTVIVSKLRKIGF